ncbi:MAG: sigma-54-dependent Fis family transcriptional regulator [Planctomycetia bacterium]|nr:sigma-54-dependent Fis family transcriptional regulator [Planctomycetia bacterium]
MIAGAPACPIVGKSAAIRDLLSVVHRAARSDANVVIFGERGSGKELVARHLHDRSPRACKPYVTVNCAAIPETLQESELMGHEKGAFTGAEREHAGLLEQAGAGTVFLDEVGDACLRMQAKLLRVLQERRLRRVLGLEERPFPARVISALNRPPEDLIAEKKLREDFYERLNVIRIDVPPLRDRLEDVPLLATALLDDLWREAGRPEAGPAVIVPEAVGLLSGLRWPGNVRALKNALASLAALHGDQIRPEHVLEYVASHPECAAGAPQDGSLPARERAFYSQALVEYLRRAAGSMRGAAKLAGIDHQRFRRLCAKWRVAAGEAMPPGSLTSQSAQERDGP